MSGLHEVLTGVGLTLLRASRRASGRRRDALDRASWTTPEWEHAARLRAQRAVVWQRWLLHVTSCLPFARALPADYFRDPYLTTAGRPEITEGPPFTDFVETEPHRFPNLNS